MALPLLARLDIHPATPRMKKVLLCVTGLSPQIVTETIYALARRPSPWVPDEVHLITTARGADNARLRLLSADPGWFTRLRQDYGLPEIRFDESKIHVIRDASGNPPPDIRDDVDNALAADTIARTVRELTLDNASEIHASLAGGRKTMGYLLGAAMSLYARREDRLSHVLVSTPFEMHPEFFYPTPGPRIINSLDRGGDALDCSTAKVWLGDIPFVRLRHLLPETVLRQDLSYAELVAMANRNLQGDDWILWPEACILKVGDRLAALSPTLTGLLMLLAARTRANKGIRAPFANHADEEWSNEAQASLHAAGWRMRTPDEFSEWIKTAADANSGFRASFEQQLSRLARRLRNDLRLPRSPIDARAPGAIGNQRAYQLDVPASRFMLGSDGEAPQLAKDNEPRSPWRARNR
jgi:CRISPR-associated protein (TIGR02584 family)